MTRLLLLTALIIVAARFFWRLVEVVVRSASAGTPPGARRGGGPPASVKMAPCAVCGTYVVPGKATSVVSGGEPAYFCSDQCRAAFQPR